MAESLIQSKPNELGCVSTYQEFLKQEGIPVVTGFYVPDIRKVELGPWRRMGGYGAYVNLEGTQGVNDSYICEIPAGQSLKPQKHMFEELIFVLSGHGATTVWVEGGKKQTFEWQEGSLFSPPLNTWYQHFSGEGSRSARFLAMTNAPTVMNLFHNLDFVFGCDYVFRDRYNQETDYFAGKAKQLGRLIWETNFVQDVRTYELEEAKERGAGGRMLLFEIANNLMSAHISQFPVGTYKKAHRHGAGAHVIILKGEGYSLMWPEGEEIRRFDWQEGSVIVPPERWFHQHFNTGGEPARYLALKAFSSRKYPGLTKQFGVSESVKHGGDQIEYEDQDPRVTTMFDEALAKRGLRSRMAEVVPELFGQQAAAG